MRPNELQRKCALLRYYLQKTEEYPTITGDTIALLQITRTAFDKWISGETSKPRTLKASNGIKQRFALQRPEDLLQEPVGVMEFGRILGLTRAECRRALDELAGELTPTFSIFSVKEDEAADFIKEHRGLYLVYRWENTEQAEKRFGRPRNLMCMVLSVRYVLSGTKILSRNLQRIRCKLNVPAYRVKTPKEYIPMHDYDGHLTPRDDGRLYYWLFEKRHSGEKDVIFLITSDLEQHAATDNGVRYLAQGMMISRTQDTVSKPMIWPIVIEWIQDLPSIYAPDADPDKDEENRFTDAHACVLDPEGFDALILEKLQESQSFVEVMR